MICEVENCYYLPFSRGITKPRKLGVVILVLEELGEHREGHHPDCNKRTHRGRLPGGDPRAECKEKIHKIGEGVESR